MTENGFVNSLAKPERGRLLLSLLTALQVSRSQETFPCVPAVRALTSLFLRSRFGPQAVPGLLRKSVVLKSGARTCYRQDSPSGGSDTARTKDLKGGLGFGLVMAPWPEDHLQEGRAPLERWNNYPFDEPMCLPS